MAAPPPKEILSHWDSMVDSLARSWPEAHVGLYSGLFLFATGYFSGNSHEAGRGTQAADLSGCSPLAPQPWGLSSMGKLHLSST